MARGTDKDDAFYFPREQLYAVAEHVPEQSKELIQPNKPYPATHSKIIMGMKHYMIRIETGNMYSIREYASGLLCGGDWTIVKESDLTPEQRRMAGLPTGDTTIAELRERIEALEARVPVEEETEWPHYADDYWYIDSALIACTAKWFGMPPDSYRRDGMGIYKTQEEAEKRANQIQKAVQNLNEGGRVHLEHVDSCLVKETLNP